jgi:hypothetical protein
LARNFLSSREYTKKQAWAYQKTRSLLFRKGIKANYFEYSTCTGAGVVGISRNWGIGRSGGADTSLVQQPQDEVRTAMALTEMARNKRIMMGLV